MDNPETEEELMAIPDRKEESGLYCWLAPERPCDATCMAYVLKPRLSKNSELSEQQAHCTTLVNLERAGRNITILTEIKERELTRRDISEADKLRTEQLPVVKYDPFKGSHQ